MGIDQRSNGNYRVRKTINGKTYSVTFDHKPREREIQSAILQLVREKEEKQEQEAIARSVCTVKDAIYEYIEIKRERISPSYIRELYHFERKFTEQFLKKNIYELTQIEVDREIANWIKKGLTYKTIKNYFTTFNSISKKIARRTFEADMLPAKPKAKEPYIPKREEVKQILEYLKENEPEYYCPIALCTYGLRRGEVLALTIDDLSPDNIISVTKALCRDVDNNFVVKGTKTPDSVRQIKISDDLADMIRKQGYIYDKSPHHLTRKLYAVQDKLGIEHFSLHKLRHFAVTELWQMGVPVPDIKWLLGYEKDSDVMEVVYTHSRLADDKERRNAVMDNFSKSILG